MKRNVTRLALILALAIVVLPAPARAAAAPPPVRARMLVGTAELARTLDRDAPIILHIARERAHYDQGHIPGARFVAWNEITATREGVPNELPPVEVLSQLFSRLGVGDKRPIVLYGDSAGLSAARAYFTLDYLGHGERAALLDGGLEKWRAERRPVSTTPEEPKPTPFTVRLKPETVVALSQMRDASWVATNQAPGAVALVDARPPAEFSGETPGDGISRGGHIPGASNVFWKEHLVSDANPVLRAERDLRALFERAGAAPGRKVIVYCRTGGQASHAYFVAKYLGYDVAMYDGSFFEWSGASDTPVRSGK